MEGKLLNPSIVWFGYGPLRNGFFHLCLNCYWSKPLLKVCWTSVSRKCNVASGASSILIPSKYGSNHTYRNYYHEMFVLILILVRAKQQFACDARQPCLYLQSCWILYVFLLEQEESVKCLHMDYRGIACAAWLIINILLLFFHYSFLLTSSFICCCITQKLFWNWCIILIQVKPYDLKPGYPKLG